jgi:integrase
VTIRQRRGGWQIIVYAGLDPLTGKQRQLTRQVNGSRRQAEKVEARLRTEVADGKHAGTRIKTLGELVDLWIERRAASDKPISPDTVEDYRSLIAKKIKPALGGKCLHTVNARVLDTFYDDLRRHGNAKAAARARARARADAAARGDDANQAAATAKPTANDQRLGANRVRDVHVILSGALGMAARWGWIPFNPALVVRPAGGKGKPRPVPSPEQVRELFAALSDEPDFVVFLRLSTTAGLRPSEVCALRWLDLNLDAMTVTIPPDGSIVRQEPAAEVRPQGPQEPPQRAAPGARRGHGRTAPRPPRPLRAARPAARRPVGPTGVRVRSDAGWPDPLAAGYGQQAVHGAGAPARARLHAVRPAALHGDPARRRRRGRDGAGADGARQPCGHERLHAPGQRG